MQDLPTAHHMAAARSAPYGQVVLSYDERLLRRKRLVTTAGEGFLVDLAEVSNLDLFFGFLLDDGRVIEVVAAQEPVLVITGPQLTQYAWHIGNRHTPCQVEADRLVIRADHVLAAMLGQLGAKVELDDLAFRPMMGAYGTGRPMGHDHGEDHGHGHGHGHDHHGHSHSHSHSHGNGHSHSHAHVPFKI